LTSSPASAGVTIERVAPASADAAALVAELDVTLGAAYTPEQRHGLSFDALFAPHVRFFVARLDGVAAGCGGVAFFDGYAEVKRMYVRPAVRGRGVAPALLERIEREARDAGAPVARLETGVHQHAALRLYERAGYVRCAAFGEYRSLPPEAVATSLFYEKPLNSG
jgi:putative acetyltransferase